MIRKARTRRPRYLFDIVAVVFLLSFALAIAYPRWRAGVDWRDEGLLAFGAIRVAHGDIPHRDFVSLQPPLSFYTTAAAFKIGGTSLATLREFGLTIFLLLPVLLYGIGRALKAGPVLALCAAAPLCFLGPPFAGYVPFAVWQGIAALCAAVVILIAAITTNRRWLAVLSGMLVAISGLLRHDQTVYTFLSLLIFLGILMLLDDPAFPRKAMKRLTVFWLGGILVVAMPAFLFWWMIGALPESFRQLVVFPFATYRKTSALPFPRITAGRSLAERLVAFLFYLPLILQLSGAVYLVQRLWRRRFSFNEAVLAFLVVWSGLFYLQVAVRSDQAHLVLTFPPFFLLAAFLFAAANRAIGQRRITNTVVAIATGAIVAAYSWVVHPILMPDISHETDQIDVDRGGVRVAQGRVITSFVKSVQTYVAPNQSMLALPYQPLFYFLADRHNPTRWNYLWPGDQTTEDHRQFVEQARRDPPAIILLSDERELPAYAPTITDYIRSDYVQTATFGRLVIYIRRGAE